MKKIKQDFGFMGHTHALSAVAMYLLIMVVYPPFIMKFLHTEDPYLIFASALVVSGGALLPDFDNVKSTAISTLGIIGKTISGFMRLTATMIYNTTKTKYDNKEADPHRLFWHTIASAFLVGTIVLLTTSLDVKIQAKENSFSISFIFAIFWFVLSLRLSIAALFGAYNRKLKKGSISRKIIIFVLMIIFAIMTFIKAPNTLKYDWIAYSITFGYIIHILGDTITKSGTPLLWPIKFKGKRWFYHRIIKITAGGEVENIVLVPLFTIIIIYSIFKIVGYLQ